MSKFNLSKLSKKEKLDLFKVEELEPRLETAWDDNDTCTVNHGCPVPTTDIDTDSLG